MNPPLDLLRVSPQFKNWGGGACQLAPCCYGIDGTVYFMPSVEHETLEDGCIRIKVGDLTGTVSSHHLVPTKEKQLVWMPGARGRRFAPPAKGLMSENSSTSRQDALAGLRKWTLVRDDESDPGGRIYRDPTGNTYFSVTRILSATAPQHQRDALERWLARPDAEAERQQAAMRGTKAHEHAEYILKTARKISATTQLTSVERGPQAAQMGWNVLQRESYQPTALDKAITRRS